MIQTTKAKLAANALKDKYEKVFHGDVVKRTRAMFTALNAAVVMEALPPNATYSALSFGC